MEAPRKIQPITLENRQHTANSNVITYAQWIQSDEGDDVVMVMEASRLVPRPRCYAHSGERIGQGQRCGFLRFGSQVDVLLSGSSRIEVTVGDYVNGGSGIIGTLVRDSQTQELPVETIES